MKRLLLALLACGLPITAANKASADCVYLAYYYYDNPSLSGASCGRMYIFCNSTYQEGCQTQYYNLYGGCSCP